MRYIIIILMGLFLASCSGTGIKNISSINSMMTSSKGTLFVGRESGFVGSANLYNIILNGKKIGEVGAGETVIGELVPGSNTVQAKFGGFIEYEMGSDTYTFDTSNDSNKFIIVTMKMGGFSNSLRLMEVTEASFKNSMR